MTSPSTPHTGTTTNYTDPPFSMSHTPNTSTESGKITNPTDSPSSAPVKQYSQAPFNKDNPPGNVSSSSKDSTSHASQNIPHKAGKLHTTDHYKAKRHSQGSQNYQDTTYLITIFHSPNLPAHSLSITISSEPSPAIRPATLASTTGQPSYSTPLMP